MKYEIVAKWGLRARREPRVVNGNIMTVLRNGSVVDAVDHHDGGSYRWAKIAIGDEYGWMAVPTHLAIEFVESEGEFRWTHWPTDHVYYPNSRRLAVNQKFGANKETYSKWGLDGHEGIDFYALHGHSIYSVAGGVVFKVGDDRESRRNGGHNYGVRVYIRHIDGYESIYAHLDSRAVDVGDEVKGGQIIGYADNTGNSFGDHLHLTMKHPDGQKGWPHRIIDPTRFMMDFLRG